MFEIPGLFQSVQNSLTGKCFPIFPGFPVRVGTQSYVSWKTNSFNVIGLTNTRMIRHYFRAFSITPHHVSSRTSLSLRLQSYFKLVYTKRLPNCYLHLVSSILSDKFDHFIAFVALCCQLNGATTDLFRFLCRLLPPFLCCLSCFLFWRCLYFHGHFF